MKETGFGYPRLHLNFPIRYRDSSWMAATFPASIDRICSLLPSSKLIPIEVNPGIAILNFTAMEYKDIDGLSPYNEFAITVPVKFTGTDRQPDQIIHYVLEMPVMTEEALKLGVEFYGYPKFLADISFEDIGDIRRCQVRASGQDIITFGVKILPTEQRTLTINHGTMKQGQLCITQIWGRGQLGTTDVKGTASYILGGHLVANRLKSVVIQDVSLSSQWAPKWQLLLPSPGETSRLS